MLLFSVLWVSRVGCPAQANVAVSYYREMLGNKAFDEIKSEDDLSVWLKTAVGNLLYNADS